MDHRKEMQLQMYILISLEEIYWHLSRDQKKRDYAVFFLHSLNFKDAKTNATTESYLGMFAVLCIPGIATYRRISEYVTHTDIFP